MINGITLTILFYFSCTCLTYCYIIYISKSVICTIFLAQWSRTDAFLFIKVLAFCHIIFPLFPFNIYNERCLSVLRLIVIYQTHFKTFLICCIFINRAFFKKFRCKRKITITPNKIFCIVLRTF